MSSQMIKNERSPPACEKPAPAILKGDHDKALADTTAAILLSVADRLIAGFRQLLQSDIKPRAGGLGVQRLSGIHGLRAVAAIGIVFFQRLSPMCLLSPLTYCNHHAAADL